MILRCISQVIVDKSIDRLDRDHAFRERKCLVESMDASRSWHIPKEPATAEQIGKSSRWQGSGYTDVSVGSTSIR